MTGGMMAAPRHKVKNTWIRSFTVTDPTKHEKGFTVYKVTYRAFSFEKPEDITETVVWKRYNDFKKLHKALYQLHYNLRRPEKFPVFAKAKFFGRFDDDVIEERRQSALRLLEFVSKIAPLTRSNFFKRFFEGGEEVAIKRSHQGKILQPEVVLPVSANGASHQSSSTSRDAASTTPEEGKEHCTLSEGQTGSPSLGGVWLHRKTEEDLAEYETMDYDDDEDDRTTFSEDSMPSTPLPQVQDISFFDPLSDTEQQSTGESANIPQSNSWLFQAMDMCAILSEDLVQDSPDNSTVADSTTDLSTDSGITINFPKPGSEAQTTGLHSLNPTVNKANDGGTAVADDSAEESRNERSTMARAYLNCIRAQQAAERDAMYPDGGMVDSRTLNVRPWSDDSGGMGVGSVVVGGEEDYLYQAAYHISLALENEANGSYQAAFDLYKSGVGVLLKGVIADDNKARREAVRRKTAQYLMKAEDLYNKYLSVDATNSRRWEPEPNPIDIDPRSAHLRRSPDELKNFKVLGLIDSVLLVLDTTSYQTFVIKVLQKCSIASKRATSVPANCRYVVKLYRFIETDDALYLVLEHASGGKLWSYASGFLNHRTEASYNEAVAGSLERSVDNGGTVHGSSFSKEDKTGENVFLLTEEGASALCDSAADYSAELNRISDGKSEAEDLSSAMPPQREDSYVDLVINYSEAATSHSLNDSNPQIERNSIPHELADLDIQDTEANLNDLADQCSQYDNIGVHSEQPDILLSEVGRDRVDEQSNKIAVAPVSLFSIDSIESPSSELHSGGSVDKTVFGFWTPQTSPKPVPNEERPATHLINTAELTEWSGHNPEEVIADALKVMEDIEKDTDNLELGVETSNNRLNVSGFDGFLSLPLKAENVDTLPDTSGFASAMADDMTVSTPGTDLAEFFETNLVGNNTLEMPKSRPPPPLKHSMSMYERGGLGNSPTKHKNPLDLRITRSASFEDQSKTKDDVLSSLMQANVEDRNGFESFSVWESRNGDDDKAKNQPDLSEILGEASSKAGPAGSKIEQFSSAAAVSKENMKRPSVTLPHDLNISSHKNLPDKNIVAGNLKGLLPSKHSSIVGSPNNLSPTSNQDSSDATLHSSCESTPKHAVYSPEFDSGAVMDSPNIDGPDLCLASEESLSVPAQENTVADSDLTSSESNNVHHSPTVTEGGESIPKTRAAPLPSLTTLFAQIDERVSVTKSQTLPESCVRLWAAEILLALTDLHAAGIICQDLQPDNILLAEGGHIRLTYFSQWQYVERTLSTFSKENFYTAPEVNGIFNVTSACDWWSFGVLLFELLTGSSLHSCHPSGINSHTQLIIPDHVSPEACSLIRQLLQVNPQERLGSQSAGGAEEIRIHQFFKDINWTSLQKTAYS